MNSNSENYGKERFADKGRSTAEFSSFDIKNK